MPFIPFIVIGIIMFVVFSAKRQEQQKNAARQAEAAARRHAAMMAENAAKNQSVSEAERLRRQEELKRRLQENAARRESERARGIPTAPAAKPTDRRPLERTAMQNALRSEKPIAAHRDDDCGGGSIHDGYHEGVTQFAGRAEASVAGNLGHRLADEDERIEKEHLAAENAKRAMARIAKLPPLAQGMIYSEILGKPRSETA